MSLKRYGSSPSELANFVQDASRKSGGLYVSTTAAIVGQFAIIHALTATVIATMTTENPGLIQTPGDTDGVVTSVALAAGDEIEALITAFTLTSGSVIAYYRP